MACQHKPRHKVLKRRLCLVSWLNLPCGDYVHHDPFHFLVRLNLNLIVTEITAQNSYGEVSYLPAFVGVSETEIVVEGASSITKFASHNPRGGKLNLQLCPRTFPRFDLLASAVHGTSLQSILISLATLQCLAVASAVAIKVVVFAHVAVNKNRNLHYFRNVIFQCCALRLFPTIET